MKLQAKQRLQALPKFMYEDVENEVREKKHYEQLVKLCEKLVDIQNKIKVKMVGGFDLVQRPVAKELLTEETGASFAFMDNKKLHALAFNKLPFDKDPPEDFKEKFLKKFSGKEAVSKLWIYRRALRSYMDQPQYMKWRTILDATEKEIAR